MPNRRHKKETLRRGLDFITVEHGNRPCRMRSAHKGRTGQRDRAPRRWMADHAVCLQYENRNKERRSPHGQRQDPFRQGRSPTVAS